MPRPWWFLVVLGPALQLGCRGAVDIEVKDTEGRRAKVHCDPKKGCSVAAPAGSGEKLTVSSPGRLVGLCVPGPNGQITPSECRALTCNSDDDCPPAHGLDRGSCINSLCVEPAGTLSTTDAVMLCLAGTGLGRSSRIQVERYAMALNCGSPCIVPQVCRQP